MQELQNCPRDQFMIISAQTGNKLKKPDLQVPRPTVYQIVHVFLSYIFYTPEEHVLLSQNSHIHINQKHVFLQ